MSIRSIGVMNINHSIIKTSAWVLSKRRTGFQQMLRC